MNIEFKLTVRLYDLCESLLGAEHKLTHYFYSAREKMIEAHGLDDFEMLAMLNYPEKL